MRDPIVAISLTCPGVFWFERRWRVLRQEGAIVKGEITIQLCVLSDVYVVWHDQRTRINHVIL